MYKTEVQRVVYKLADFGLAKVYKNGQAVEGLGERGTRPYFPPEMTTYRTQNPFPTKAVDIWCLCLALCESIGGKRNYNDLRHSAYNFEPGHSLELCNLVILMTNDDPHKRITIDEVFRTQFVRDGPQNMI